MVCSGYGSNVFYILQTPSADEVQEVILNDLTLTGGDTSGGDVGGGIAFLGNSDSTDSAAKLTIRNSTITGNHAGGSLNFGGSGGGLYASLYGNGSSLDSSLDHHQQRLTRWRRTIELSLRSR
jgi:hypothetical protein